MNEQTLNRVGAMALRLVDGMDETLRTPEAVALAALLGFAEGQPIGYLPDVIGLSQPGTAHLIARLESDGLVERRVRSDDRRVNAVYLTRKGRRRATALRDARIDFLRDELSLLEPEDAERLGRICERLLQVGTTGRAHARRTCRVCHVPACGHPDCPVTTGADAAELASRDHR